MQVAGDSVDGLEDAVVGDRPATVDRSGKGSRADVEALCAQAADDEDGLDDVVDLVSGAGVFFQRRDPPVRRHPGEPDLGADRAAAWPAEPYAWKQVTDDEMAALAVELRGAMIKARLLRRREDHGEAYRDALRSCRFDQMMTGSQVAGSHRHAQVAAGTARIESAKSVLEAGVALPVGPKQQVDRLGSRHFELDGAVDGVPRRI